MVGGLLAGSKVCTGISVRERTEFVAVYHCTGILGNIGGSIVHGQFTRLIIETVVPDGNIAERLEVYKDGLVEAGIPVCPRMLRIVSGSLFEELFAIGHLIIDDNAFGRINTLVTSDTTGFGRALFPLVGVKYLAQITSGQLMSVQYPS